MDGPKEVASGFVVARSNGLILLQGCEEVLDQMPSHVEVTVIFVRLFVRHPGRNDHCLAFVQQRFDRPGLGISWALLAVTVCAGGSFSSASVPLRSWAWSGVRRKHVGFLRASTVAWILVLRPPLLRPRACLSGSPLLHLRCAGGRARWWRRAWRIRCPHPTPRP